MQSAKNDLSPQEKATNSPESKSVYPLRVFAGHIASSSISNIMGVIVGHPFDTIKVSLPF